LTLLPVNSFAFPYIPAMICHHRSKATGSTSHELKSPKLSQNKSFLSISRYISGIYYSNRMLTNTTSIHDKCKKLGIEENLLDLTKVVYNKPVANMIFNGGRKNTLSLKSRPSQSVCSHYFYSTSCWKY
jgi:hypothetical protein